MADFTTYVLPKSHPQVILPSPQVVTFVYQKIDFSSSLELVVTMGALAAGMWWLFDRSKGGLGLSVTFTFLSTAVTHLLLSYSAIT